MGAFWKLLDLFSFWDAPFVLFRVVWTRFLHEGAQKGPHGFSIGHERAPLVCRALATRDRVRGAPSSILGGQQAGRELRRDRQEAMTAHRSRPRKIGVGSPASWSTDADCGRVFRNGLQVLAKPFVR